MRSRRSSLSFLLLAAFLSGCGSTPSVRYLVAISPSNPRSVQVTAEWRGVPRDSLVLGGFESTEVLRISGLQALDESGAARSVQPTTGTLLADGRKISVPRYIIRGPLPSRIRIRYRVDPDVREGDAHVGFSGVRYGYLGPEFGAITGRNLFLLPVGHDQPRGNIRVHFSLPAGWRAVTPWRQVGDDFRPGIGGRFADEDLIASTLAFGRFSERSVSIGRTRYRFAYETGHQDAAVVDSAIGSLERATRTVQALFGRDLGSDYVTVVLPATPDGNEIHGEAWAGGQGGTLSPMTPTRLRRYSQSLLEGYLKFSPYRDEISRPEEYWVLDGIANLYAWRAVAATGMVDEEEVERDLASSYAGARRVQDAERDLEKLYETKLDTELSRRVEAPFLLAYLDRLLRERSGGRETLDRVVRNMFRTRPAASLWASIPGSKSRDWDAFRARYVRGKEAIPSNRLFGFAPAEPTPSPPAGKPVRDLTVIFTGDTNGFLEHCGCKANQSGGVARRATVLERLRREYPGAPVVDLGNAFTRPENQTELDYLSREEQRLYLETMAAMRYDASAIGMNELLFGSGWFREVTKGLGIPYVSSNVAERGTPLAPAFRIVPAGGLRVAVVSALEPAHGPGALPQFEANTAALSISDPVSSLAGAVSEVRDHADLVIVIGRLEPGTIRRVVRAVPGIDVILSSASGTSALIRTPGTPETSSDQGFLGKTLVLYEDSRNYGLESVNLLLDAVNRVASAATTHYWLYEDVPDQPRIRAMLNRFYDRVGTRDSAQASVRPLFANSPARMTAVYAGAARCARCHAAEYAQWKTTRHATAYKTLLDAHRHYQPRCVVCHVVGFRTRNGYKLGDPEEPLANVQCEVCHGPGGAHATEPVHARMERTPPESTCLECHNPQHSDAFVYAEKIRLVQHRAGVISAR
ncbi:MAG TPA: multiheme c-type cytochrome [Candidatus Limnocylindrales bacterium]|nr:multiheme c-type cytochrome [Candidatus Limnocylindrales bacterium]